MEAQDSKDLSFLCFGGQDWWYHNRGHIDFQLMRRFAKDRAVLYVNSIVMQKPSLRSGAKIVEKITRKAKSIFTGLKKTDAGFWAYSPLSFPVQHLSWARPFNEALLRFQLWHAMSRTGMNNPVVWVACPTACNIALKMPKTKLVYQRTDRFEHFPCVDSETVMAYDRKLKASADLTLYASHDLYEEETAQCKRAFYLDHGVDFELFSSAEQDANRPADIAGIQRPIVGYFGALNDHKFDIPFIETVMDLLPDMSFAFVGKVGLDCSGWSRRKNVCLLGQKPYEQIPHYGKCFDVAIIPWQTNRWTQAANPIKLKEYFSLGKPLVSTPAFSELQQYLDVVYQAKTPHEFADCIRLALSEDTPGRIRARKKKAENASWDSKAQLVLAEILGSSCTPEEKLESTGALA